MCPSISSILIVILSGIVPHIPHFLQPLMAWLHIPSLPSLISHFLYEQYHPDLTVPVEEIPLEECPKYTGQIYLYPSTVATYHTPSDNSGLGGLFHECIQAVHSWRGGPARHDCVDMWKPEGLSVKIDMSQSFRYEDWGLRSVNVYQMSVLCKRNKYREI